MTSVTACRIFDLDGTISDPAVGIGRCFNHALQHHGHAPIADGDLSGLIGPPLDRCFGSIVGPTSSDHLAALVAKYRERYADVGYAENVIYPGIAEALQALHGAGIPLGVCTSKRADFAERILELFGIRRFFRFVSGGDVGIRKADQLASLLAAGTVGTSATMIGDRAIDVAAAKANGMGSIAVLWGHGSRAELQLARPDALVESPHELLDLCASGRAPIAEHR